MRFSNKFGASFESSVVFPDADGVAGVSAAKADAATVLSLFISCKVSLTNRQRVEKRPTVLSPLLISSHRLCPMASQVGSSNAGSDPWDQVTLSCPYQ